MSYAEFLAQKAVIESPSGFEPDRSTNPMLFSFQADIVRWAIRRGRIWRRFILGGGQWLKEV